MAIEAADLEFGYGDGAVLRGVSLSVADGETLAVMGHNGAGKTTLLRLIAGLAEPDAGTVSVDGDGPVGFAPEDPAAALFAPTVEREVAFFPENRGIDPGPPTERALRAMGIEGLRDRAPSSLSVGEQRRVSIAAVLSGEPAALAFDEPTGGLDRAGERELAGHLRGLDAAAVVCTHEPDFALDVADRVAVLDDGELGPVGPAAEVLADEAALAAAGVRPPGRLAWARANGFERAPADVAEALAMLGEGP